VAKAYDVVVVGAGSNSLTAAAYLAKVGKNVLVLEKNAKCGGGVHSVEPAPGFIGDPCATSFIICIANPVLTHDELGLLSKFGLKLVKADATFATAFDDGTGIITYTDVDKTCQTIAKFSQRDADTYRSFANACLELLPLLAKGMFTPPPPFGAFLSMLEQSPQGRQLVTAMLSSTYDVLDDLFESPELKMHIMKWASELMVPPETNGTGIAPYMMLGLAHTYGPTASVGGSQSLTTALERCIEYYGGTIRTNADVVKINISSGKATGVTLKGGEVIDAREAVVANIHPWDLAEFVDGINTEIAASARRTKLSTYSAINQQFALHEAPIWKAGPEYGRVAFVECVKRNLQEARASFDGYRFGRMPQHPSPLVGVWSNYDQTRAPAGKAAMYCYHFAPMHLEKGGLEGWDAVKDEVADTIFDEMCKYTTNMDRSKVIARYVTTPLDYHRLSKVMRHGDIFGIGHYASQSMGRRPIPELGDYRIPGIESLYLAGCTQHPGGCVTLGGRATTMKMLMDWKIDLKKAFVSL